MHGCPPFLNYLVKCFSSYNVWLKHLSSSPSLIMSTHNGFSFIWISVSLMIYWSHVFCVLLLQINYKLFKNRASVYILANDEDLRNKKYLFFYLYVCQSVLKWDFKRQSQLIFIWKYQYNEIKASIILVWFRRLSIFLTSPLFFNLTCLKSLWQFYPEVYSKAKQQL